MLLNPTFIHRWRVGDWCGGADLVSVGAVTTAALPVVLTVIEDPELSAGADRIAAAVGARAVGTAEPNRRNWLAAVAVILDEAAARRCADAGMPRRDGVALIGTEYPSASMWAAAIDVGAQIVCALPDQEANLVRHVAESAERGGPTVHNGRVIAVTAGPGGGGASVFSAALARCAPGALLMDMSTIDAKGKVKVTVPRLVDEAPTEDVG